MVNGEECRAVVYSDTYDVKEGEEVGGLASSLDLEKIIPGD